MTPSARRQKAQRRVSTSPERRYCFVATGYLVRDGRTLLLKHKKLGMWLPPGGHIEEGEATDEAVLREVLEETGLEAEFLAPPRAPVMRGGRVESLHEPQRVQIEEIPGHNHHLDFIYYLRAKAGAHAHRPDESDDSRWHTAEELGLPHVPDEVRESGRDAIRCAGARAAAAHLTGTRPRPTMPQNRRKK